MKKPGSGSEIDNRIQKVREAAEMHPDLMKIMGVCLQFKILLWSEMLSALSRLMTVAA